LLSRSICVKLESRKEEKKKIQKEGRTMLRHNGGETVGKGTYWNLGNGERIDIAEQGILPGDAKKTFYRMPAAAVLVAAPVLGLMYAAFLPFIGIAMVVKLVAQKVGGGVMETVQGSASFGWRPSESYLSGRKKRAKKDEASKDSEENKS
jgi:hypothetical protein